jgi:hypothetical protein
MQVYITRGGGGGAGGEGEGVRMQLLYTLPVHEPGDTVCKQCDNMQVPNLLMNSEKERKLTYCDLDPRGS